MGFGFVIEMEGRDGRVVGDLSRGVRRSGTKSKFESHFNSFGPEGV